MAVLFFIAGYFSAAAYDRKTFSQFVRDRVFRLGLPTLLYMLVIGPLTQYYLSRTWGSGGFAHQRLLDLRDGGGRGGNRPRLVFLCPFEFFHLLRFFLLARVGVILTHFNVGG